MAHLDVGMILSKGPLHALKKLFQMRTMKVGRLVGTDYNGNSYYENRELYAHGQHRWVEYSGGKAFYDNDSSTVAPEWHGWLHHVTEDPPTATTVGSTQGVPPQALAQHSSNPNARSLGGVVTAHPPPNVTQVRARGWGLGNGLGSAPFAPETAYTQPGLPTDPRNAAFYGRRASRAARLGFTLADTPLTLAARESARAGLPLQDFARYVDDESPTSVLLRLMERMGSQSASPADIAALAQDASLPPEEAAFLREAAEGLPEGAAARQLAMRMCASPVAPADAYHAALEAALSPSELECAQLEEEQVLQQAARYQRIVDDYKDIRHADAAAGVAAAVEKRDALLAQVSAAEGAEGKRAEGSHTWHARAAHNAPTLTHSRTHTHSLTRAPQQIPLIRSALAKVAKVDAHFEEIAKKNAAEVLQ